MLCLYCETEVETSVHLRDCRDRNYDKVEYLHKRRERLLKELADIQRQLELYEDC